MLVAIPLLLNRAGCLVAVDLSSGAEAGVVVAAVLVVVVVVVDAAFFEIAVSEMRRCARTACNGDSSVDWATGRDLLVLVVVVACCCCLWLWCFEDGRRVRAVDDDGDDDDADADFERLWEKWSRLGWRFVDVVRMLERLDARECRKGDGRGCGNGWCLVVIDERVLLFAVAKALVELFMPVGVGVADEGGKVFEAVDVEVEVDVVVIEVMEEEAVPGVESLVIAAADGGGGCGGCGGVWLFVGVVVVLVFWLAAVWLLVGDLLVLALILLILLVLLLLPLILLVVVGVILLSP